MMGALTLLLAAAFLTLAGCASLALGLSRNWSSVTGEPLAEPTRRIVRRSGWALVSLALPICILRDGAGFAALTWPLLFAASAFSVAIALSFRPAILQRVARVYLHIAKTDADHSSA